MAAGLGFKEFTTGDVLTAADANGFLASQVVMVFDDAAARTTAITSPQEGMITYLKDTNAVEKYDGAAFVAVAGGSSPLTTKGDLYTFSTVDARLEVGADGTTLVADSVEATGLKWVAAASGGMTSIASGSLSGGSLSLTSIVATFKDLFLVIRNASFSGNANVTMRVNNVTTGVYDQLGLNVSLAAFTGYGSQNATSTGLTFFGSSGQGGYILSSKFVDYAKTTTRKQIHSHASYEKHSNAGSESTVKFDTVREASAIDRIDVILSGGATFSAGTFILYGVN